MHAAVICKDKSGYKNLELTQVKTPALNEEEVLMKIEAAGVNYPDVLICEGRYQFQPPYPFTPGGEAAGVVEAVGSRVRGLKKGDRVMSLFPAGAFQEKIALHESRLSRIPEGMNFLQAAGFQMTYGTTLFALRDRGELKPGETVLVLGASGGVGIAAIEIAKALGATVIAGASSDDKLQVCKAHGADHLINYSSEDLKKRVMEITDSAGVDVIYDAVGGDLAEKALRAMRWRGRFLVIGFVAGIPKIPLNLTLLKGCSIVGVFWGDYTRREPEKFAADLVLLGEMARKRQIDPSPTEIYALPETKTAIGRLAERKVKGKAVIVMGNKTGGKL